MSAGRLIDGPRVVLKNLINPGVVMNRFQNLSLDDFRAALTRPQISSMQIIQAFLAFGVVLFAGVVVLMNISLGSPERELPQDFAVQTIWLMTVVHLVLAVIIYLAAPRIENLIYKQAKNNTATTATAIPLAVQALGVMRTARIVRLALYEGVALLGLVICYLAMTMNVLVAHPLYWVNAATAVIMIAYVISTFPNAERLTTIFHEKLRQAS